MKRRRLLALATAALLVLGCGLHASAMEIPYQSYTYDRDNKEQPAPALYAADLEVGYGSPEQPSNLTDLFVYRQRLYALDSACSCVRVLDLDLQMVDTLYFQGEDGSPVTFSQAQSLFVCDGGVYISDSARLRVERFGWDGVRIHSYERPDSPAYDVTVPFAVTKILVDQGRNVYALVDGLYAGAVMLSEEGDFLGFFGPNEVEMTLEMRIDQSWKKLLTDAQKNAMDRFVPIAYTSFDIDGENFVYTCSRNAISESTRVRKLNPSGKGLWDGKALLFGDYIPQSQWVSGLANVSQIVDVDIGENGVLSILDAARGRVFQYDANGALLGIFGGAGKQVGTFEKAACLESCGKYVFVLDGKTSKVTRFVTTDYGERMHRAVALYAGGEYQLAKPLWEDILARNSYCQPALTGIGRALLQEERYGEALAYLKLGQDRQSYSDAFEAYRFQFMRAHFPELLLGAVAVSAGVWGLVVLLKKRAAGSGVLRHLAMLKAPIATLDDLVYRRQLSPAFSTGVVLIWFFLEILKYFGTGFPFNTNDPAQFNIFLTVMTTGVLYGLFVLVNWAVSRLTDGLGTFKQLYCAVAYAVLPYLITQALVLLLSQVFILDEAAFLTMIALTGYVWSGILLVIILARIHDFTLGKTCWNLLLTLFGILVVLFLLFLLVVLFEQVANLIVTVYNELTLRA